MPAGRMHALEGFADAIAEPFFVQIGSNDGVSGDPLYPYITRLHWQGLLVEPLPHLYRDLLDSYRGVPNVRFENAAIGPQPGKREFYYLRDTSDPMPPWYRQLGSFDRNHVLKHSDAIPAIEKYIECMPVAVMTFDELAAKHGIDGFDLLHIDAESYDYEILRTVDLAKYRPALIIYEHRHLAPADKAACAALLRKHGYGLSDDGENIWASLRIARPHARPIAATQSPVAAGEKAIMTPYEILRCAWPRPVEEHAYQWVSEPEWDAPLTHIRPQPAWRKLNEDDCWTIDWRELFRAGEAFGGEMCGFHVVFEIRVNATGTLIFYSDDGCIIRRNGETIHSDRASHPAVRNEVSVKTGDRLEIAQWQYHRDWVWGARIEAPARDLAAQLADWLPAVRERLSEPDGPPLKMYCHGLTPLRTVVAVYSMILNGYAPKGVYLYGDYQWPPAAREVFARLLPFAQIGAYAETAATVRRFGGDVLEQMARNHWFVMKCCVCLLCGPSEFCLMDDDLFILGDVGDALGAFRDCDFVFTPDANSEDYYQVLWRDVFGHPNLNRTGSLNTGLYWLRRRLEPEEIARMLLRGQGNLSAAWAWEQGFFANLYADSPVLRLPPQRYFYPLFDGLPGGVTGYDYALNPCGFASIHFGGPVNKPGDSLMEVLAPQILGRQAAVRRSLVTV
jgi:FkbM family methyltransferase